MTSGKCAFILFLEFARTNVFVFTSTFEIQSGHHILQLTYRNMAIPLLDMSPISKTMLYKFMCFYSLIRYSNGIIS